MNKLLVIIIFVSVVFAFGEKPEYQRQINQNKEDINSLQARIIMNESINNANYDELQKIKKELYSLKTRKYKIIQEE